jgi:hypothetical protein
VGKPRQVAGHVDLPRNQITNVVKSSTRDRHVVDTSQSRLSDNPYPLIPVDPRIKSREGDDNGMNGRLIKSRLTLQQRFDSRQNTRLLISYIMFDTKHNQTSDTKTLCPRLKSCSRLDFISVETFYTLKISTPINKKFPNMLQKCNSAFQFAKLSLI